MHWKKLFLITYWIRKDNFNILTFLVDTYIILGALAFIIYCLYYHATLRDENNSHATCFIENINCNNELVLEGISEFNKNYKLIG